MSRFAFRLPLSVITERGPGGEVPQLLIFRSTPIRLNV